MSHSNIRMEGMHVVQPSWLVSSLPSSNLAFVALGRDHPPVVIHSYLSALLEFSKNAGQHPDGIEILDIQSSSGSTIYCLYFLVKVPNPIVVDTVKTILLTSSLLHHELDFKILDDMNTKTGHLLSPPALASAGGTIFGFVQRDKRGNERGLAASDLDFRNIYVDIIQEAKQLESQFLLSVLPVFNKFGLDIQKIDHEEIWSAEGRKSVDLYRGVSSIPGELIDYQHIRVKFEVAQEVITKMFESTSDVTPASSFMRAISRDLQYICWRNNAEAVVREKSPMMNSRSKLVVFGLNETIFLEEMIDVLLIEAYPNCDNSSPPDDTRLGSSKGCSLQALGNYTPVESTSAPPETSSILDGATVGIQFPSIDAPTVNRDSFGFKQMEEKFRQASQNYTVNWRHTMKYKLGRLKGQPANIILKILPKLTFTDGVYMVCKSLKLMGFKLALVTQGFDPIAQIVGQWLGFDHVLNNHLEVVDGILTGRLTGEAVGVDSEHQMDPLRKADWLQMLIDKEGITPSDVFVIGDYKHADFLEDLCGYRIYFNARRHRDMRRVLYMMGFKQSDVMELESRFQHNETFGGYSCRHLTLSDLLSASPHLLGQFHKTTVTQQMGATDKDAETGRAVAEMRKRAESDSAIQPSSELAPDAHTQVKAHVYIYGKKTRGVVYRLLNSMQGNSKDDDVVIKVLSQVKLQNTFSMELTLVWRCYPDIEEVDELSQLNTFDTSNITMKGNVDCEDELTIDRNGSISADTLRHNVLKNLVFEATAMKLKIRFKILQADSSASPPSPIHSVTDCSQVATQYSDTPEADTANASQTQSEQQVEVCEAQTNSSERLNGGKAVLADASVLLEPIKSPQSTSMAKPYIIVLVAENSIPLKALTSLFCTLKNYPLFFKSIRRLTECKMRVVEIRIGLSTSDRCAVDASAPVRSALLSFSTEFGVDVALQADDILRYNRRLVVFDMDSTLIQQEAIDELANYMGVGEAVSQITKNAMAGRLDFHESLRQRVAMLKGMPREALKELEKKLTFTPGAFTLCQILRAVGFRLAVISGGFTELARYAKETLGLDFAFANTLEFVDGVATGQLLGPVVTPQRKASVLQMLADLEQCSIDQVIAVGDGANDIPMLMRAGMGVAFCASQKVQEKADVRMNHRDLADILYLLGMAERAASKLLLCAP